MMYLGVFPSPYLLFHQKVRFVFLSFALLKNLKNVHAFVLAWGKHCFKFASRLFLLNVVLLWYNIYKSESVVQPSSLEVMEKFKIVRWRSVVPFPV